MTLEKQFVYIDYLKQQFNDASGSLSALATIVSKLDDDDFNKDMRNFLIESIMSINDFVDDTNSCLDNAIKELEKSIKK